VSGARRVGGAPPQATHDAIITSVLGPFLPRENRRLPTGIQVNQRTAITGVIKPGLDKQTYRSYYLKMVRVRHLDLIHKGGKQV
jgi:hypothetical protein